MKLKFTRKTWYFFLLAAAAMSMLGGFAVLGGMDFSFLEMAAFCITGITLLFLAAEKGSSAKDKRNYFGLFVVLMLSKLGASGRGGGVRRPRGGEEATLKHFHRQGETVMLLADNTAVCPPMVFAGPQLEEIQIEGRAVGFCRGL